MNQLPQAPCPHCQAAVTWYFPGCFSCRKPIQWAPPQNEQQAQLQKAAVALFQQQLAGEQQRAAAPPEQQQQQQPLRPGTAVSPQPVRPGTAVSPQPVRPQTAPPVQSNPPPQPVRPVTVPPALSPQDGAGGDMVEGLEQTKFATVQYDPQQAEDVDGFTSGRFEEFVPREVQTVAVENLETTEYDQGGVAAVATPMSAGDAVESTLFAPVQVGVDNVPDLDRASFSAETAGVAEQAVDPLLERTQVDDIAETIAKDAAVAARRKKAQLLDRRICKDCGTVSDKNRCPACGAATQEFKK